MGPQDASDMTSRLELVTLLREACEVEDVGLAIWQHSNNASLFDSVAGTWGTPLRFLANHGLAVTLKW